MRCISVALGIWLLLGCAVSSRAAPLSIDPGNYDKNGDGRIDRTEARIFLLHRAEPILARFDKGKKGYLDESDIKRLVAEVNDTKKIESSSDFQALLSTYRPPLPVPAARQDEKEWETGQPTKKIDDCKTGDDVQNAYVRNDMMNNFIYRVTPRDKAKGASASLTGDEHGTKTRVGQINAFAAYVLYRSPCSYFLNEKQTSGPGFYGIATAPWVLATGNWNDEQDKEKSALQLGWALQFGYLSPPGFDYAATSFSPYYQTDFRGRAHAYGLKTAWEPMRKDIFLGAASPLAYGAPLSELLQFYWTLALESDFRHVDDVGLTNLVDQNYAMLGTTVKFHFGFFPDITGIVENPYLKIPDSIRGRLNGDIALRWYRNVNTNESIRYYSLSLAYDLTDDHQSSIGVTYERGTKEETMATLNQWLVSLNYKY